MNSCLIKSVRSYLNIKSIVTKSYQIRTLSVLKTPKENKPLNQNSVPSTTVFPKPTTSENTLLPTTELSTTTMGPDDPNAAGWRLPQNCRPTNYDLTLIPDLQSGNYKGNIDIDFEVTREVSTIKLHTKNLEIEGVVKLQPGTNQISHEINEEKEMLIIKPLYGVKPGQYKLKIPFKGNMTNKMVGFYRSKYLNKNNERYIATSKFEPTYARQAFPCFDEPNFKASYTVHIVTPKEGNYIALSNMDVNKTDSYDANNHIVTFNPSVEMSTYVTCFIVCDFKYKETSVTDSNNRTTLLRVYATPEQVNNTQYALDIAKNVTEYYLEYFDVPYPLPKLDMIAIPDFVSGAMEHWGLVTYRETALLYDEEKSSVVNQERVATVVAHELAHMWFGNLVTLDWWNDLWLNEGFATYMQYKAIDKINPEWAMAEQFLIDQLHPVLNFDSTLASHPIVQTVVTPDQITEIFDSISYNKGASVLRMLENAIGEDNFKKGIHNYLDKYKFKNAVTQNLWDELQAINPEVNVTDVMDTWTVQMGYPVINVKKQQNGSIVVQQERFLADPDNPDNGDQPSKYDYKWTIPLTYITSSNSEPTLVWFNRNNNAVLINETDVKWIKLNHKQIGYYRVKYPEEMWNALTEDFQTLSTGDKVNLLDDAFSIANSGGIKYYIPLELTKKLKNVSDYIPWSVAASKLKKLKKYINKYDYSEKLKKHVHNIITDVYKDVTWNETKDDSHLKNLLRAQILDLACTFHFQDAISTAESKFKEWLAGTEQSSNVKALVYHYGMETAKTEEWEAVFQKYVQEIDAQEKTKLLKALASTKHVSLLNNLLEKAEDEKIIRSQDYFTCLRFISQNDVGTPIIWEYVRNNWPKLVERFTLNDRFLGNLIPFITSSFDNELKLNETLAFFSLNPEAGAGEIARKQALETIKNNIKWLKNYQHDVELWLDQII